MWIVSRKVFIRASPKESARTFWHRSSRSPLANDIIQMTYGLVSHLHSHDQGVTEPLLHSLSRVSDYKILVLADLKISGKVPRSGRGRNKIAELGHVGWQCLHTCGAEVDQNEESVSKTLLNPIDRGSVSGETQSADLELVDGHWQWSRYTAELNVSVTQEPAEKNQIRLQAEQK